MKESIERVARISLVGLALTIWGIGADLGLTQEQVMNEIRNNPVKEYAAKFENQLTKIYGDGKANCAYTALGAVFGALYLGIRGNKTETASR